LRVLPALLTSNPRELERMLHEAEAFTDRVQVDIMDGRFVPSESISAQDLARVKARLFMEVHLMVMEPEAHLEAFHEAGAGRVVFHYEATLSPSRTIALARHLGLGVGLALNPQTPILEAKPLFGEVDFLLLLSVDPGFYGSPFIPPVLEKAKGLRPLFLGEIGMDGGIKAENIRQVKEAGVDYACVGSGIFRSPDPARAYRELRALAQDKEVP
jgi:ribulose-phosphate 3-epimerase